MGVIVKNVRFQIIGVDVKYKLHSVDFGEVYYLRH